MDIFSPPKPPTYEADKITRIRLLRALHGDARSKHTGNEATGTSGEFTLTWTGLTTVEANSMFRFFDAHDGYKAFEYTLPLEPNARFFICREWTRRETRPRYEIIHATFEEVIDP